ncbi:hypothetical protein [Planctomicrobium piriforme]|uniref:Uncharacterized protein n=1 Tax=Planctomicrobium piriforme TaxID=1576369 RepID=A0A1I3E3D3_9PLAN|nr:hypothetical protein [Planctomicrobium piriforme]SFH93507.1 hypothetical protein SAMN05421753_10464 [Planctomicrobium piriforme]
MFTALKIFTFVHVVLSLVGIAAGFVVLARMLKNRQSPEWTKLFLWTTVLTSVTGFGFPVDRFLPSHAIGILSLVALAAAIYALSARHLAGRWRKVYVVNAVIALYFNVFVLIVQLFLKVPPLHALAPSQSEPPFAIAQGAALLAFIVLGTLATLRFRGQAVVENAA